MKLCVLGLGYIGLPTAVMFAKQDIQVHGVDINPDVVTVLNKKEVHINEPGLKEMMIEVMDKGKFTVSDQPQGADAFIIAVPTPLTSNKQANLDYVKSAAHMVLPHLKKGTLIVLESTVPPKTIDNVLIPILEQTGYIIGEELFVSHSPERVLPGNLFEELISNDRIVGGVNEISSKMTVDLYKRFVKGTIHITDTTTAEMVKLMENTYRDVNIALANELARIAEQIGFNVWKAIELANCHPRVNIHKPGPGVGGHCIAVDPWFIVEQLPTESKLISLSRTINDSMPYHVIQKIDDIVKEFKEPVISVLGLAFKENIDDIRESPSLIIMRELRKRGYHLKIYDPYVKSFVEGKVATLEEAAVDSDCLVILTDHDIFKKIDFQQIKNLLRNKMVFDTRNTVNQAELEKLGFICIQLGSPEKGSKNGEKI